ncbi:MAG: molybdopterin-guanine dinucleotide biosynthesis protein B [Desulfobulbaceae bacterium]|nr:molybdopterin-guanine dinucleotide biosynthesis protein B [Desulfobulbaceae bacterium]
MTPALHELPILGVCGASGSGKTTLILQMVQLLRQKGLKVLVAKQSPKKLAVDRPGKDSERFFTAGADVWMQGSEETFARRHKVVEDDFYLELIALAAQYDVVLVEGYRQTICPMVWLLAAGEVTPPENDHLLACLAWDTDRPQAMETILADFLAQRWLRVPVLSCVLIGGKSSRMGQAKQLLWKDGQTWLTRTASCLANVSQQVVVAGAGEMGGCLLPRILDVPDCQGPLAGILAAMRWQPWATLMVCACDLPDMSIEALAWLLAQRTPGVRAVIPKIGTYHQPLFALYDFRMRQVFESMASRRIHRLSSIIGLDGVRVVSPPPELCGAWRNVNSPEML